MSPVEWVRQSARLFLFECTSLIAVLTAVVAKREKNNGDRYSRSLPNPKCYSRRGILIDDVPRLTSKVVATRTQRFTIKTSLTKISRRCVRSVNVLLGSTDGNGFITGLCLEVLSGTRPVARDPCNRVTFCWRPKFSVSVETRTLLVEL